MKYVVCDVSNKKFIQKGFHFNYIRESIDEATVFNNKTEASYYEDDEFKAIEIEIKLKGVK